MNAISQNQFDGREMLLVHDMLRREVALLPGLVGGVTAGDHARAQIVGDHIEGVIAVLHHHHLGEDEHLWPLLLDRCGDSAAALVRQMEAQHQEVADGLHAVGEALRDWRGRVTVASGSALAQSLDRLLVSLREHLSIEESHVIPLMERRITAAEWNEAVRKGAASADPEQLPLGLGMLMYEGDPEVIDQAIANVSAHSRPHIRQLAAQAFAAHSMQVHGTPTPPRSTELRPEEHT